MEIAEFKVPEGPLQISPIGDIQYGAQGCDVEKLKRHIDYGLEHGWYFIGMGDYLDTFSPSNQVLVQMPGLYESGRELLDDAVHARVSELAGILRAEGRWLGVVEGDHKYEFSDGQPSDHLLARKLGTPFLGTAAFVVVRIAGHKAPLVIWAFHGKATSSSNPTGLTLDFGRKQNGFEADVFLMGHAHQLYTVPRDQLFPYKHGREWRIGHKTILYAASGSFLNGWALGSKGLTGYPGGSYVEKKGLVPIPTGAPLITVTPIERYGRHEFEIRGSC